MKSKKTLQEKYVIAKRKSAELMNQVRKDFMYDEIDVAFAMEEELSWYLIKVIDEIDNGVMPRYTSLEHLKRLAVYYSKFLKLRERREFVPTQNKYKNKKYLFFTPDDQHYSRLINLIKEFPNNKKVLLITHTKTQQKAKREGFDFVSFGDYLIKPKKKFKISLKKIEWRYKGVDLKKTLINLIKSLELKAKWITYYIESLKRMYKEMEIEKIITIDSVVPINRTAILVAKKMGIESWIVKSEIVSKESGRYLLPMLADKICVYGKHDGEFLIKSGINKNRIFAVGMDLKAKERGELNQFNQKLIVFFSHFYDDLYSLEKEEKPRIIKKLLEVAKKMKGGYKIVIKLHPREEKNIYGKHENITIVRDSQSAEALIEAAELVLVSSSNTGLKAIAMNKPLIVLDYANIYIPIDYKKYNIPVLKYEDNIIKAIKNYNIKKERRKALLKYYCGDMSSPNLAVKRITRLLSMKK